MDWATAISVVAFLVAWACWWRAPDASGAGVAVALVFILLLAATAVAGLVAAIVEQCGCTGWSPSGAGGTPDVHYPVRAHAYRYPPRHRWTWVFSWLVLLLGLGVVALPALVDGVADRGSGEVAALILFAIYKTVRQCDGIDSTQARAWRSASCRRAGQPQAPGLQAISSKYGRAAGAGGRLGEEETRRRTPRRA